jgi:hypothetical protein
MEYGGDYGGAASPGYTGYGANGQGIPGSVNLANAGGTMSTTPFQMPNFHPNFNSGGGGSPMVSLPQTPQNLSSQMAVQTPGFRSIYKWTGLMNNPYAIGLMRGQDA